MVKISNPTVISIIETKIHNSNSDSEICRSNRVSRNTVRQLQLDQYDKRKMAYTGGSENKLISERLNIRRRKKEHNKRCK